MMKYAYITAIIDLKFNERLHQPIKLKENYYITNNPLHTAGLIGIDKMYTIGSLEAELLTKDNPVIYRLHDVTNQLDAHVEVINLLRETQAFLQAIWLLKDNSANCELAFAFCQDSPHTHSNALSLHYGTSDGKKVLTTLSVEELKTVCNTHTNHFQGAREQDKLHPTIFHGQTTRLDRAGLFLQQARSSDDLGQKIANYCSCFESLFSTNSVELSHQLSERCAFFLEESPVERLNWFKKIKKAYGIRSKIIHGDKLKPPAVSDLVEISKTCDDVARKSFNRIFNYSKLELIFSGSNENLDEFMQNLIFGIQRNAITAENAKEENKNSINI